MELISLGFTALYFRCGRTLFTTRPSRGINHKSISRDPSFRFADSYLSLALSLCLSLARARTSSSSHPAVGASFAKCKSHEMRAVKTQKRTTDTNRVNRERSYFGLSIPALSALKTRLRARASG